MGRRKRREVPPRLLRLKQRFADWRKSRTPGERIPSPLWKSAAKLAKEYGLGQTATVLKLDYYSLKAHVDQQAADTTSSATFIELPAAPVANTGECTIELEDGAGASIRMHLKNTEIPDVLALARSFWNAE
jgi:hypothetical protein